MPRKTALPAQVYDISALTLAKSIKVLLYFICSIFCLDALVRDTTAHDLSTVGPRYPSRYLTDFTCPICSQESNRRSPTRAALVLNVKGAFPYGFWFLQRAIFADFGLSLSLLKLSLYTWVFLRRNKNPSSLLWIWFENISSRHMVSLLCLWTD
jgi:hypothetical protein